MLVVISPAKRLDWTGRDIVATEPRMQDQATILAGHARQLTRADLATLMGLSDSLAKLNLERFRDMASAPTPENSRPAAWAFAGDTYQGLEIDTLDGTARDFAEHHLRILSGLYGVLRPRDAIQAHRLEMGTRLKTRRGNSLVAFWGDRIARMLREDAAAVGSRFLVNCASQEYFAAVDRTALGLEVITPRFLDEKNGQAKVISFHAKRARGAMARHLCENRITDPRDLLSFDAGGYLHAPELSEPGAPVFLRSERVARRVA